VLWDAWEVVLLNKATAPAQDLNGLVTAKSGWTLSEANGINDAGQIIARGDYTDPDPDPNFPTITFTGHACLLTPMQFSIDAGAVVTQILSGIVGDSPGMGRVLGVGWPFPVPPWTPWRTMSPAMQDVLLGLALNHAASMLNSGDARAQIQRTALDVVSTGVQALIRSIR